MLDPLLFGAYVALFVGSLYAVAHFVAIRVSALPVHGVEGVRKTRQFHGQDDN
jgi:hypothetical protein